MNPLVTVTQKPVSPGRARHSLLKPSRRECRCFGFICGSNLCAFYQCTQGCGCSQTPGIPCALFFFRGRLACTTRVLFASRECGVLSFFPSRGGGGSAGRSEARWVTGWGKIAAKSTPPPRRSFHSP